MKQFGRTYRKRTSLTRQITDTRFGDDRNRCPRLENS